jgi:hypothetical protein
MTDNDRQAQKDAATGKLLDAYAKLVEMTTLELVHSGKAKRLTETVDRMTENQAKAMLIAKIASDAVHAPESHDRNQAE